MFGTFLSPDTCGFAKIAALDIEKQVNSADKKNGESSSDKATEAKQLQYREFNANFNTGNACENKFQNRL